MLEKVTLREPVMVNVNGLPPLSVPCCVVVVATVAVQVLGSSVPVKESTVPEAESVSTQENVVDAVCETCSEPVEVADAVTFAF